MKHSKLLDTSVELAVKKPKRMHGCLRLLSELAGTVLFGSMLGIVIVVLYEETTNWYDKLDDRPLPPVLYLPANRTGDSPELNPEPILECGKTLPTASRKFRTGPKKFEYLPWLATLRTRYSPIWQGSLINERYVLLGAHYLTATRRYSPLFPLASVRLGDFNRNSRDEKFRHEDYAIKRIIVHEEYNKTTRANDIALVELAESVIFRKTIAPICLRNNQSIAPGDAAFISKYDNDEMIRIDVKLTDLDACRSIFSKLLANETSDFLCVAPTEETEDDYCLAGGTLFVERGGRAELIGLYTYGWEDCSPGNPAVFTRISGHLAWITKNTRT